MTADTDLGASSKYVDMDARNNCRDLVVLLFRAVLRRDPEKSDAEAFTNAVQEGMPIYDFVSELMCTPEFRTTVLQDVTLHSLETPIAAATTVEIPELLSLSIGLLQARLVDKGCQVQLGPAIDAAVDDGAGALRMERMLRTLAALDVL